MLDNISESVVGRNKVNQQRKNLGTFKKYGVRIALLRLEIARHERVIRLLTKAMTEHWVLDSVKAQAREHIGERKKELYSLRFLMKNIQSYRGVSRRRCGLATGPDDAVGLAVDLAEGVNERLIERLLRARRMLL